MFLFPFSGTCTLCLLRFYTCFCFWSFVSKSVSISYGFLPRTEIGIILSLGVCLNSCPSNKRHQLRCLQQQLVAVYMLFFSSSKDLLINSDWRNAEIILEFFFFNEFSCFSVMMST